MCSTRMQVTKVLLIVLSSAFSLVASLFQQVPLQELLLLHSTLSGVACPHQPHAKHGALSLGHTEAGLKFSLRHLLTGWEARDGKSNWVVRLANSSLCPKKPTTRTV